MTNTFNADNQVTNAGYAYDGDGNPTTYKGQALIFDPENRLTSYGSAQTDRYSADGLRAWKQNGSGRTYFLYDGERPVCEVSAGGVLPATNTFGTDRLASRRAGGAGAGSANGKYIIMAANGGSGRGLRVASALTGYSTEDSVNRHSDIPTGLHEEVVTFSRFSGAGSTGTMSLYLDGVLIGSTATKVSPDSLGATPKDGIGGGSPFSADPTFNGSVSQFAVFSGARSATDLLADFKNGGVSAPAVPEASTTASLGLLLALGLGGLAVARRKRAAR